MDIPVLSFIIIMNFSLWSCFFMFTLVYADVSDSALQIPFLLLLIFGSATQHEAIVHL